MAPILELSGVALTFPNAAAPVFHEIDLEIARGETVTLVGASGAGKSSLLRVVAGLLKPGAGQVVRHVQTRPDRLALAMVFQEARLMPWRSVADNVALGLEALTLTPVAAQARVRDALALVGLGAFGERWAHELSGGQRQRVGIARALAVDPDLLLMDEPFGALDAITRQGLQDELLRIQAQTGKSILFVTHDIDEAVKLGDRALLLGGSPARIVKTYPMPVDRPRDAALAGETAARIRRDLHSLFAFESGGGI